MTGGTNRDIVSHRFPTADLDTDSGTLGLSPKHVCFGASEVFFPISEGWG